MQRSLEPVRRARPRAEPEAAIPQFRELGISAVIAACAWRKPRPLKSRKVEESATLPRVKEG